ncbi:VirB4 family type IV secretion/conjugal transfer ATPase, partial [Mesorhizobium sp. M7A.T.Ca.US.000.02.1.1]
MRLLFTARIQEEKRMNRTQAATNREVPVSRTIPYSSHIAEHVVSTVGGDLVTVFKVSGIAHESADVEDIDSWHNRLNGLLKTIQSPNVTLYTHTVRQERGEYPKGEYEPGSFAAEVDEVYRARVMKDRMMVNDLYLTVVFSPDSHSVKKLIARIFDRLDPAEARAKIQDAQEALEDVARQVMAGLSDWGPARLGWYEHEGVMFSEIMELFGFLLNGEWQRWPVPRLRPGEDKSIAQILATARPFFGKEAFELRGATQS